MLTATKVLISDVDVTKTRDPDFSAEKQNNISELNIS